MPTKPKPITKISGVLRLVLTEGAFNMNADWFVDLDAGQVSTTRRAKREGFDPTIALLCGEEGQQALRLKNNTTYAAVLSTKPLKGGRAFRITQDYEIRFGGARNWLVNSNCDALLRVLSPLGNPVFKHCGYPDCDPECGSTTRTPTVKTLYIKLTPIKSKKK